MRPAAWPRERAAARLLHIDPRARTLVDRNVADLPALLTSGDVIVFNDAATLPASFSVSTPRGPAELRLAGPGASSAEWSAVLFGAGDWRRRTEDRAAPASVATGDEIAFEGGLRAHVERVSSLSPRLVELRFDRAGAALWPMLYRAGRPIQYSHLVGPLSLWHVQTPFGARPWAVEMPSAGAGLGPASFAALRARGVAVTSITHAAGLSATGDAVLDAALPLPERYAIGAPAVALIEHARARRGRIVAVGTSVVRALEGALEEGGGMLRAGEGITDLRLGPNTPRRIVDGLLTGIHEPGGSHYELQRAFAPDTLLAEAHARADALGYLGHEFGDRALVLAA